jgi:hypothetical protein
LQIAVDDEHEVVELLAHRQRERAHALGLVHFAIAQERPDLAIGDRRQAAVFHVALKARLVDSHHGPETHGNGRELPEVGHQPGMRVRGKSVTRHFVAEVLELLFAQTALEEGTRVDAG